MLRPRLWVYLAIVLAIVFHAALLPFTVEQTYDSYIHMFFGDHYHRSWFDPWEPRWYTGFTVTAYPPGSHQILGLLMYLVDMKAAFILAQLLAIILLVIGVYRFSRLWVSAQASANASLLLVFSTSISETLHIFGQLPTTLSIALFLNATPHIYGWIKDGRKREILPGLIFTAAATSVHHVTPIFGTIFFVAPLGVAAWLASLGNQSPPLKKGLISFIKWVSPAPIRGVAIGVAMLMLIIIVVFPYWHWSITDPITQVSIPHGSRENFIKRPNLGLMFFVIPWGFMILTLPFVIYKTATTTLWPLGLSVLVTFILGTGGTTPIAELILGPAFWILTLDRFTFWSSLLILPFAGLAIESLRVGRANTWLRAAFGLRFTRLSLGLFATCFALASVMVALIPSVRPTQPDFVDPTPIATFMDEDQHWKWRYLTLGFGDQFAYHSAKINAESVDGNYHSARRLPTLMNYSVERLENSKYSGVPGLASLGQFLINAENFNLKFIFSNDEFYDPLLHYTGWNPITRLRNNVVVWEKTDISPLPALRPRRTLPRYQVLMWGTIPMGALILAGFLFVILAVRGRLLCDEDRPDTVTISPLETQISKKIIFSLRLTCFIIVTSFLAFSYKIYKNESRPLDASETIEAYYGDIDFRKVRDAFDRLDPEHGLQFDEYIKEQRLTGGLLPSYGKLTNVEVLQPLAENDSDPNLYPVSLRYLTSLGIKAVTRKEQLTQNAEGVWKMRYRPLPKFLMERVTLRTKSFDFLDLKTLRSSLTTSTDLEVIARPLLSLSDARLVYDDSRFYVVGEVENRSTFPACAKVLATALDAQNVPMLTQAAGRIGAHRLLPGERSPFRIDFEGFMKISDSYLGEAFDPDQFSLPEFENPPRQATVDLWGAVCSVPRYKNIRIDQTEIVTVRGTETKLLKLSVTNTGTKIVSTLQFKMGYYTPSNELIWVDSDFLQTNLIPGEQRALSFPLKTGLADMKYGDVAAFTVNGSLAEFEPSSEIPTIPLPNGLGLSLNFDAMVYEPLR